MGEPIYSKGGGAWPPRAFIHVNAPKDMNNKTPAVTQGSAINLETSFLVRMELLLAPKVQKLNKIIKNRNPGQYGCIRDPHIKPQNANVNPAKLLLFVTGIA